ncbi:MAG TPA: hypothetical protein ENJ23_02680, partial [Bacteroidetes bacterium]|nr:hypothetical protein [Bacteroidota bacterium]
MHLRIFRKQWRIAVKGGTASMKRFNVCAWPVTALLILAVSAFAQDKRVMNIQDVFKVKSLSDTELSPDGKWILFGVREADFKKNRYNTDVWLVQSTGGQPIRLTYTPEAERNWRWAPDGTKVAFISDRDGKGQIYLLSMKGGEAEKLTKSKTGVSAFRWSPDGKKIAFLAREPLTEEQKKKREHRDDAKVVDKEFR